MTPRLLDLFCGAGGAAMGYHRAGFEVVGVDVKHQPHYPFDREVADAIHVLRREQQFVGAFDAIHASPPCQAYTAYRRKGMGVGDGYPELIAELRVLLEAIGKPYVIENVEGAPLRMPVRCCGSSFGLDVRRHRLFEAVGVPLVGKQCRHEWQTPRFPQATNRRNLRRTVEIGVWRIPLDVQKRAMGVNWDVTLPELSEMVPPAYTEFIGRQLRAAIQSEAA